MKGGEFNFEAVKIVRGSVQLPSSSWMGLYSQLPSQEDRFEVMKNAVEPQFVFSGNDDVSIPHVPVNVTKEYLPRFNLSPSQVAEIRKGLEAFEKD